ncbi:MAG: hypothetical protein SFU83_05300 [Meiothermus sp.]|nr:hypothetical protein [Meiothermus sp.]
MSVLTPDNPNAPTSLGARAQHRTFLFPLALLLSFLACFWPSALAQSALAGTIISNQAQVSFAESTQPYFSNVVETLVQAVCAPTITPNGTQGSPAQRAVVSAGGFAYFPYLLRNAGNQRSTFALSSAQNAATWAPRWVRLYLDQNEDSRLDPGEPQVASLSLDVGEQRRLVMEVALPANATGDLLVTPTASCVTGERDDDNFSQISVGTGPSLNLTKSTSRTTLDTNQETTFGLLVANLGSTRTGGPVSVTDWLNTPELAGLSIVPGSAEATKGRLEYSADGTTWSSLEGTQVLGVRLVLDGLEAGEQAVFSFRMRLGEGSSNGLRRNLATAEGPGGPAVAAVELTVAPRFAHRLGPLGRPEASGAQDRQSGTARVGQSYCFSHSLINLGNAPDRYTLELGVLPPGITASFRQGSGPLAQPILLGQGERSDFQLCLGGLDQQTPSFEVTLNAVSQTTGAVDPTYDILGVTYDPASVRLLKSTDRASAMPGESVNYTLQISNPFPVAMTNLRVRDQLDERLEFVEASSGGSFEPASREVVWTVGSLGVGQTLTLSLRVRVASTTNDGQIPNRFSLRADQFDDTATSNTVSLPILTSSIQLLKRVTPAQAVVGDTLTFTLTLQNTGKTDLVIEVVDTPGKGLRYVEQSAQPAASAQRGEGLVWSGLELPAGATRSLSYKMRVLAGAPELLENRAVATGVNTQGVAVAAASAAASVKLDRAVFTPINILSGRVFLDSDRDGRYTAGLDIPLPGARLVLSNGMQTLSDKDGRYAFRELRGGAWEIFLDPASAPFKPLPHPEQLGEGYRHRVTVNGLTNSDFPLERPLGQAVVQRETTLEFGPLKVYKRLIALPAGLRVVLEVNSSEPMNDLTVSDPVPGGGLREFKFDKLEGPQTVTYDLPITPGFYLTDPQARWRYP